MLCYSVSYRKLDDLVDTIYALDWAEVPSFKARRGTRRNDASPGRTASGGDF